MKMHFIGVNGVSMKVLASISEANGNAVSGSDLSLFGHDKNNVVGKDLVVYSGAIGADNEELSYAKQIGIPVMERADFLAYVASSFGKVIAVAGCHGKTTTTAMLAETLKKEKPTVHIGGEYDYPPVGEKKIFITEACEYRRSFLRLKPDVALVTNIDFDHPDTYADIGCVAEAFRQFGENSKKVIFNGDDALCREVYPNGISFGTGSDNDYLARPFGKNEFDVYYHDHYMGSYTLNCPGAFNMMNAVAAIVTAFECGACFVDISEGIKRFNGVRRRGEIVYSDGNSVVVSDYSHHPAEIKARIKELKAEYKSVAVIFQPHTYSRTKAMPERFSAAFDAADYVAITNTFAAREKGGDDFLLYRLVGARRKCEFVERGGVPGLTLALMGKYDCVAVMGAGDVQGALNFPLKP